MEVKILKGAGAKFKDIKLEELSSMSDSIRINGRKYEVKRILDLDNEQIVLRIRDRRGKIKNKKKKRGR